jgi:2-polyprenyl-3-methyl-5-hydroxy-6-metoxy-1,4-benzoquinol methylase
MAELDNFDTARTFDAMIGRLVLVHLSDASGTLRRFRNFLTPNGLIAFQEMDLQLEMQVPAS